MYRRHLCYVLANSLPDLFFDPDSGGNMTFRNVEVSAVFKR
jgi:hypothetical protein